MNRNDNEFTRRVLEELLVGVDAPELPTRWTDMQIIPEPLTSTGEVGLRLRVSSESLERLRAIMRTR